MRPGRRMVEGSALPAVLLAGAALLLGPGPGGFWDAFDYLRQMATFDLTGGLMLGRTGFAGTGALVFHAARSVGLDPMGAAWAVSFAVLGTAILSAHLMTRWLSSLGVRSAGAGALLWALSPVVAVLSFSAMSELPAMALVLGGLGLSARAWTKGPEGGAAAAACGAALVGLSLCVREPAVAWAVPLVLVPLLSPGVPRRLAAWALLGGFLGVVASVTVTIIAFPDVAPSLVRWRDFMAAEAVRNPTTLGAQLRVWALWTAVSAPVALPLSVLGVRALMTTPAGLRDPRAILGGFGVASLLALAFYQDLSWGPRYLVPALPGLVLLGAVGLDAVGTRGRIAVAVALAVTLGAALPLTAPLRHLARAGRDAPRSLEAVPRGAVVAAGWLCPALTFQSAALGRPLPWTLLCPGWLWPDERLPSVVQGHLRAGTRVYALVDAALWPGERFSANLEALQSLRGVVLRPVEPGLAEIVTDVGTAP